MKAIAKPVWASFVATFSIYALRNFGFHHSVNFEVLSVHDLLNFHIENSFVA